ncbi:co-chaperone GroES [Massilimicrobiota timonensis]|uniref:Co-chaperonin GroES n=1 Tax=Massilimicrobiota timonensis TaxID=1776392 RepID=A0ABT7ULG5_9FIRM|nr:co-chaperone GroES [Massilimicrobiota timonensis]MDM8196362.1 co-chaperone GroES [Massilimicrobiota timonensis]
MLKPLHDYVILKKEKAETQTASGIILTNPKEQASNQATVVSVGPKCDEHLKEGMTVIFKEYSGTKFKDNDDEYMILEEEDILAIIE